jgi:hypothetical protein
MFSIRDVQRRQRIATFRNKRLAAGNVAMMAQRKTAPENKRRLPVPLIVESLPLTRR